MNFEDKLLTQDGSIQLIVDIRQQNLYLCHQLIQGHSKTCLILVFQLTRLYIHQILEAILLIPEELLLPNLEGTFVVQELDQVSLESSRNEVELNVQQEVAVKEVVSFPQLQQAVVVKDVDSIPQHQQADLVKDLYS